MGNEGPVPHYEYVVDRRTPDPVGKIGRNRHFLPASLLKLTQTITGNIDGAVFVKPDTLYDPGQSILQSVPHTAGGDGEQFDIGIWIRSRGYGG